MIYLLQAIPFVGRNGPIRFFSDVRSHIGRHGSADKPTEPIARCCPDRRPVLSIRCASRTSWQIVSFLQLAVSLKTDPPPTQQKLNDDGIAILNTRAGFAPLTAPLRTPSYCKHQTVSRFICNVIAPWYDCWVDSSASQLESDQSDLFSF